MLADPRLCHHCGCARTSWKFAAKRRDVSWSLSAYLSGRSRYGGEDRQRYISTHGHKTVVFAPYSETLIGKLANSGDILGRSDVHSQQPERGKRKEGGIYYRTFFLQISLPSYLSAPFKVTLSPLVRELSL